MAACGGGHWGSKAPGVAWLLEGRGKSGTRNLKFGNMWVASAGARADDPTRRARGGSIYGGDCGLVRTGVGRLIAGAGNDGGYERVNFG